MMKPHRGGTSLRVETGETDPLGLSVSASRSGKVLTITCVNPRHDTALALRCELAGGASASASARLLAHPDFNAGNDFENPSRIAPRAPGQSPSGRSAAATPPARALPPEPDVSWLPIPKVVARLCAGGGSFETGGQVEGHQAFDAAWLRRKG